jgi:hypothetical protein
MPVTIKKKKSDVKTVKTKKPGTTNAQAGGQQPPPGAKAKTPEAGPSQAPQAAASQQQPASVQPQGPVHNYTIDVSIALVAFLTFLVLIFVQVSELSYYSAYPSVWPSPTVSASAPAVDTQD